MDEGIKDWEDQRFDHEEDRLERCPEGPGRRPCLPRVLRQVRLSLLSWIFSCEVNEDIVFMYPLVNIQKAIENCHFLWVFPLKMVIFHSYVSLPEGTCRYFMIFHCWVVDERKFALDLYGESTWTGSQSNIHSGDEEILSSSSKQALKAATEYFEETQLASAQYMPSQADFIWSCCNCDLRARSLRGNAWNLWWPEKKRWRSESRSAPIGATENQSNQPWEKPQCHIAYILDKNAEIWDKILDIMGTLRCLFSDGHGTLW